MKPLAAEWVAKAESDYATARREPRARKQPNFDAVCFHARQCAEKYPRRNTQGLLQEHRLAIPRTHNLDALAKPLLDAHSALALLAADMRTLGAYAVETRYPGKSADRGLAKEALELCDRIRRVRRKAFTARR